MLNFARRSEQQSMIRVLPTIKGFSVDSNRFRCFECGAPECDVTKVHKINRAGTTDSLNYKILFLFLIWTFQYGEIQGQKPPPNYSHANMPVTNFTCDNKTTGGYYADPEAGCQMFHVCVRISEEEIKDYKFLCPNNTVFDQKNFICTNWWEIDCEKSTHYYSKNDLFKPVETTTIPEVEYENRDGNSYYEYVYEYVDDTVPNDGSTSTNLEGRHRLSLGKSVREEKAVQVGDVSNNLAKDSSGPAVSSSVSVSKPRTTYSTSAIRRTSVNVSKPTSTKNPTTRASTTATTTTTTTVSTTQSTTESPPTTPAPGNLDTKFSFQLGSIGKSVVEPVISSDSNDPFANYDWKKESTGVTSSVKTRYEKDFSRANSGSNAANTNTARPLPEVEIRKNRRRNNRRRIIEREKKNPKAKLQEFSNFRFYKTAFGVSYSSDDYFTPVSTTTTTTTTTTTPSTTTVGNRHHHHHQEPARRTGRSRSSDDQVSASQQIRRSLESRPRRGFRRFRDRKNRRAKNAARGTRYSKYGR